MGCWLIGQKEGIVWSKNTIFSSCWSILGPVGPYLTLFGAETPFLVPLVEFVLKSKFRKKNCCIVFECFSCNLLRTDHCRDGWVGWKWDCHPVSQLGQECVTSVQCQQVAFMNIYHQLFSKQTSKV